MEAFIKKGTRHPTTGCLIWKGRGVTNSGYAQTKWNGKTQPVHRIIVMMSEGITELPPGVVVRHGKTCVSKKCYEPTHMKKGTYRQNNYDDRVESGTLLLGEDHPRSSITNDLAKLIKHSFYPRGHSLYRTKQVRADQFGVTRSLVTEIDCGRSFSQIPGRDGKVTDTLEQRDKQTHNRTIGRKNNWSTTMFADAKTLLLDRSTESITSSYNCVPCRHFTGYVNEDTGYGYITIHNRKFGAHELACSIKYQRFLVKGEVTRHLCDGVYDCVEETHVEFGTRSQNTLDTMRYSRVCKLNPQKVTEIKEMYATGMFYQKTLAEIYDVSPTAIKNVLLNRSWIMTQS